MFKGHPKGLIAAALANMGERFGFYTMMAILVLFLQAKFGLTGTFAGEIYSTFYFLIYILAFVGGIIADRTRNYKGTIMSGLILMGLGYVAIAIPTPPNDFNLVLTCVALFVIAFGNGLFKGNLQALVGQMYDNPAYEKKRDSGFSLFYMFINVGAIFAPFAAVGVRNWWLNSNGFSYNSDLPALCHSVIDKTIAPDAIARFKEMGAAAQGSPITDINAFAQKYLDLFSTGFHYAFATAIVAMGISFIIYIVNKKHFPDPKARDAKAAVTDSKEIAMSAKEISQRIWALIAVFAVVIFFWFSFHQNGLTLTFFARDYTNLNGVGFDIFGVEFKGAELFQSLNPFFVVFLTPVVLGIFGWLSSKGIEPSTPKKIAIGMFIAALGFVVMTLGSFDLPLFSSINPTVGGSPLEEVQKVTPFLLLGTYFILTIAELFISPLGISFVSKVAPPKYQGIMQGGWLGATALGNKLLVIGAIFYESIPIWATWSIFVVACIISMFVMLFMVKWLERIAK
ncbi:MAG: peptide MFS transporter [Hyphomicrobiales bacterium]